MADYEAPTITELGSVADFTRADLYAPGFDSLSTQINNIPGNVIQPGILGTTS